MGRVPTISTPGRGECLEMSVRKYANPLQIFFFNNPNGFYCQEKDEHTATCMIQFSSNLSLSHFALYCNRILHSISQQKTHIETHFLSLLGIKILNFYSIALAMEYNMPGRLCFKLFLPISKCQIQ